MKQPVSLRSALTSQGFRRPHTQSLLPGDIVLPASPRVWRGWGINEDDADDEVVQGAAFRRAWGLRLQIREFLVPADELMDIVSPEKRSLMMAGIKGKNTKPELVVRKLVHGMGFRYRLHRKDLPGSPDLVFSRLKKVIFVHGCFWHRHSGCRFAYTPKSNAQFWLNKLEGNMARDELALAALNAMGWEVLIVWECEVRDLPALSRKVSAFLGRSTTDH